MQRSPHPHGTNPILPRAKSREERVGDYEPNASTAIPVESFAFSDVFWALTILGNLESLSKAAEKDPEGPFKNIVDEAIWCARWYYRHWEKFAPFVAAINEYEHALNVHADTSEVVPKVARLARKYRTPQVKQSIPWYVSALLILILGLCIASIPLIAVSRGCCSSTESVAIALNGVAIVLVIILFPLVYVAQRTGTIKNLDRLTREMIFTFARHERRTEPVVSPFEMNTQNEAVNEHESKAVGPPDGFIVDWKAALQKKKLATNVLAEATDEDGTVVLRAKGFPASRISFGPFNKQTIIIVTNLEGEVVLWGDGAVANCGFSSRDVEGNNINSLLYGEKSVQLYATMTEAAGKNLDISERILTLAHLTLGSISVNASVELARHTETNAVIGYALVGSVRSDDLSRMHSLFHHFFVTEIVELNIKNTSLQQIVECIQWKNLRDLAAVARDWGSVHIRRLLSEVIKGRQNQVDVAVDPAVAELPQIMCDTLGVSAVLTKSFELFPGRIRMRVEHQHTTDAIYQLKVSCQHDGSGIGREALSGVRQSANDLGGIVVETPGKLSIHLPFMVKDDAVQALRQQGILTDKESGHDPLIVLLLEKNAVHRHNISTVVWNCGHSLRIVENARKAVEAVEESTDLGCAIIDVDVKEAERILDALQAKSIYTIETSETPDGVSRRGDDALLKKPISTSALRKELEKATEKYEEAKKADEQLSKQREVFGTVRNSPWTIGRFLGKGAFATVYEATSTLTGGKMAVKIIDVNNFTDRINELMNEIAILCKLMHPNIIHYFYCERTETSLNLFMALADQGSVEDLLKKCPRLPENHVATIVKQLLQAVNYLHESGVIHRDIKPGNMLISQGQLKLSDFGTATTTTLEGMVGTPYYMAPEVIDGKESAPTKFPEDISEECVDFINACMKTNPADRATAGTLLLHDFIVHLDHEVSQLAEPPASAANNKDDVLSLDSTESSKLSWSV